MNMEVKSNFRQIIVFDAPTKGYYTADLPEAEGPVTVAGFNGISVAKQLTALFPQYQFIYQKDPSYVYDVKVDRAVQSRDASEHALISNGLAILETACHEVRRELILAEDEKRAPQYSELVAKIVSAFNTADKYFWIVEDRERKPKAPAAKSAFPGLRSPIWTKQSSDYEGDKTNEMRNKDVCCKQQDPCCKQKPTGWITTKLPFGVGYAFDGDINDIDKLTKELEAIFKGFRR